MHPLRSLSSYYLSLYACSERWLVFLHTILRTLYCATSEWITIKILHAPGYSMKVINDRYGTCLCGAKFHIFPWDLMPFFARGASGGHFSLYLLHIPCSDSLPVKRSYYCTIIPVLPSLAQALTYQIATLTSSTPDWNEEQKVTQPTPLMVPKTMQVEGRWWCRVRAMCVFIVRGMRQPRLTSFQPLTFLYTQMIVIRIKFVGTEWMFFFPGNVSACLTPTGAYTHTYTRPRAWQLPSQHTWISS